MHQLTPEQISRFIDDGFVRLDNAFPANVAAACRTILWQASGCDPDRPETWTKPVIRIGERTDPPFRDAANTPVLHQAFDQLVGQGAWLPRVSMGSFPLRFPSREPANDTGWHVDASFPGEDESDYLAWRINVRSKGRALLMLFLFSDVGEKDAPTLVRAGSHLNVARILAPAEEDGLSFMELAGRLEETKHCPEVPATGKAGTVYLCHPFLVHAAQDHRGTVPKFMAQPPLLCSKDFQLHRDNGNYCPVEKAIRKALTT